MNSVGNIPSLFGAISYIEAMNVMAFQNVQTYLKMMLLNLTTNQKPSLPSGSDKEDSNSDSSANHTEAPTTTATMTPIKRSAPSKPRKRKGSAHLWDLMSKKFSANKFKPIEEPKGACEEGETYRKLDGFYVPVLKTKAPL